MINIMNTSVLFKDGTNKTQFLPACLDTHNMGTTSCV